MQATSTVDSASNVGDGGTTGENTLNTGSYQVSETAGTSTSLSDYTSSITCRADNGTGAIVAGPQSGPGPLSVDVTDGSDIVCTITNARNTGKLEVVKDLIPGSVSPDPGLFNLFIMRATTTIDSASNVGDGGTTGENTLNTGSYL